MDNALNNVQGNTEEKKDNGADTVNNIIAGGGPILSQNQIDDLLKQLLGN